LRTCPRGVRIRRFCEQFEAITNSVPDRKPAIHARELDHERSNTSNGNRGRRIKRSHWRPAAWLYVANFMPMHYEHRQSPDDKNEESVRNFPHAA